MQRSRRLALGSLLGTAAYAALGCGDDAGGTGGGGGSGSGTTTGGGEDLSDVRYEGEATDEALEELLASATVDDALQAASFREPASGTVIDPATVLTFTWGVGPSATRDLPVRGERHASAPQRGRAAASPGLVELVVDAVLGVREAHAHGAPINGRAYFVVFSTASNPKLLRVFTTSLTYTPDTAAWATLTAAGGAITATITSAIFDQNRVAQDGGPFVGPPLSLST